MNKRFVGKIMQFTLFALVCICLIFVSTTTHTAQAALTITPGGVTDWTAVGQNTVAESGTINCSSSYTMGLYIQAFLDTTTAHAAGTDFIIQVSSTAATNEDWHDWLRFNALRGTADSEALTANPIALGATTSTVADTDAGAYETVPLGKWLAIEDGTLINSELVFEVAYTNDTDISWLDGTTTEHAQNTLIWDIAISRVYNLPLGTVRARLVIDNTVVAAGSTLNYKVLKVDTTGL
jgi:hypothetical protein